MIEFSSAEARVRAEMLLVGPRTDAASCRPRLAAADDKFLRHVDCGNRGDPRAMRSAHQFRQRLLARATAALVRRMSGGR